ncbi:AAA-ATPase [Citrus sinensis]|nr:AAA-ATPase [Citrus sinensis]
MANDFLPEPVRNYACFAFRYFFKPRSKELTLVIEDSNGIARNQIFEAAEVYLSAKIGPSIERLKICKTPNEKVITIRLEKNEQIIDSFRGVQLRWRFALVEAADGKGNSHSMRPEKRLFELTFHQTHKDMVLNSYLPHVIELAKDMKDKTRVLKMYTLHRVPDYDAIRWDSVKLEHPATFDTLAMEPDLKATIMEDLDRFVRRKEFYKRVGRAWKRGYLLYGPPGTGKSSLVAAMANYLKFDVFDLQLGNVTRDSDLRTLLLSTGNRSILVIEDIDCSVDLPDRRNGNENNADAQLTLSGLLNFIDGLWSSCGDERIIVFTTNHKERLDPALLRPGRMDMHIHMSYCGPYGFRLLAANYLGITDGEHKLVAEIETLLKTISITPAQVAEQFMKSEDADVALAALIKLLKAKERNGSGDVDGDEDEINLDEVAILESKKLKTEDQTQDKGKETAAGPIRRRRKRSSGRIRKSKN